MLKVFAVCGMGLGTSVILKSRLKEALDKHGVEYSLDVTDASTANGQDADLIFTSDELASQIRNTKAQVIVVNNFTNRSEIQEKADAALAQLQS